MKEKGRIQQGICINDEFLKWKLLSRFTILGSSKRSQNIPCLDIFISFKRFNNCISRKLKRINCNQNIGLFTCSHLLRVSLSAFGVGSTRRIGVIQGIGENYISLGIHKHKLSSQIWNYHSLLWQRNASDQTEGLRNPNLKSTLQQSKSAHQEWKGTSNDRLWNHLFISTIPPFLTAWEPIPVINSS
jgi:hypothetical protein